MLRSRLAGLTDAARAPAIRSAIKDILAGAAFIAFGLAFSVAARSYEIGTTLRMGPGYFPFVLGAVLAVLGLVIVVKGFLAGEGGEVGAIPWRPAGLVVGAVLFFGLTVRGLGLIPSLFITSLLAAFAGRGMRVVVAVPIAVGLTILSVLVFVVALGLRVPVVGPWIPV